VTTENSAEDSDGPDTDELLDLRLLEIRASADPQAWDDLGGDLLDEWRLDDAIECFTVALHLGKLDAAFGLALALDRRRREVEAAAMYERAIEAGVVKAILNHGVMLEFLGDREGARRRYEQAVAAGDALGHLRLGQLDEKAADIEAAEAHFRQAMAQGWPSAAAALGKLLVRNGKADEALPWLRQAAADPDDPSSRSWLGATLLETGQVKEARAILTAAIEADEWQSWLPLGNLRWDVDQDLAGAEDAYRRALAEFDPNAHLNLGLLLIEAGRTAEARVELTLALEEDERNRQVATDALSRLTTDEETSLPPTT
jgi:tetratricopeptide (TPR) repeat protein